MATKAQIFNSKTLNAKKFKTVPHSFTKKVLSWMYCSGCGLVNLKNEPTQKRMQQPCQSMED